MKMKKLLAMLLCGAMALSLAAYGNDQTSVKPADDASEGAVPVEPMQTEGEAVTDFTAGGWEVSAGELSPDKNPEAKAAFEKALEGMDGADYELIAYLGSQVVAGTNYRFLCRVTPVVPDAEPSYELVTAYEDLDGNAELADTSALPGLPEGGETLPGGWELNAGEVSLTANENVKAAFEKALEMLVGADYEPVAYLASQVVAGSNYMIFCRVTPVVPDAVPGFALVTIYENLKGSAELLDVTDINLAGMESDASTNTIIISVQPDVKRADVDALAEKYGLTILYDYKNFNMYAMRAARDLSASEMAELLASLESEELVLGVEPDRMMQLDDGAQTGSVQIPDPWTDYEHYDDAAIAAGFDFGAPERIEGYDAPVYRVLSGGELFEIQYQSSSGEIVLRKAAGADDVSGDYNAYSEETSDEATGATFRGNDGKVSLATWTADGYAYSVGAYDEGMDTAAMRSLVTEIIGGNNH